jgi:hypothetical protein
VHVVGNAPEPFALRDHREVLESQSAAKIPAAISSLKEA